MYYQYTYFKNGNYNNWLIYLMRKPINLIKFLTNKFRENYCKTFGINLSFVYPENISSVTVSKSGAEWDIRIHN